jgi:hypothetical protein
MARRGSIRYVVVVVVVAVAVSTAFMVCSSATVTEK